MSQTCVKLILPFPPSVNTYWGFHGNRRFLTKKALLFKNLVKIEILKNRLAKFEGDISLQIKVEFFPPDRRVRDIDNPIKPLLDSLVQGGLFNDDSQIKVMLIYMKEIKKGGIAEVEICSV